MNYVFSFLVALLMSSCVSKEIQDAAKKVKVAKADPDKNCEDLGMVKGVGLLYDDSVRESLKIDAAKKQANYVRLESIDKEKHEETGTAFKCP